MKKPYIKSLGLFVIIIFAGLVFLSVKSSKKYQFHKTAEELHAELVEGKHYIDPVKAKELISKQNKDVVFVDIRNPREFDNFHLEGAINIPMPQVLDDEFTTFFENNKTKVLYCDEIVRADQVRLILTQFGYEHIQVLQGGVNYWKANMSSTNVFESKGEYDDEKLKFDPKKLKAKK